VVAAVPVSVLAAGGSAPAAPPGSQLAAVAVPADSSTTTGIGRSICRIVGTQACSDPAPTTTGSESGSGTDSSTGTDTTMSATSGPPQSRLCGNVKLPSCTTASSSTVTVAPPSTLSDTSTSSSKTHASKTSRTKTKSRSQSTTTVTVTVTQSSSSASTGTATTP
jgi:hypothetical protein